MKAEHRKELETNALADRMGRVVQGMKQAPQKRTLLYLFAIGLVLVAIFLFSRYRVTNLEETSLHWLEFEDGHGNYLQKLITDYPHMNQGKAALAVTNYKELRDMIRVLATNPKRALDNLDLIEKSYQEMAKLVKDDKVLLPEALFAQAVIKETRIMEKDDRWEDALQAYKEVAEKHPTSAYARFARRRVEVLEDKDKRTELLNTYRALRVDFPIREDRFNPALPEGHPPIPPNMPGLPTQDAPKLEAPKLEAPKPEASKPEASKTEAPKAEAPKTDAPKGDGPKTEAPKTVPPKSEAPKTELPKKEAPK